jgi:hypothetical protein
MEPAKPLGLAVVGLGWFALRVHLPALRKLERASHSPVRVVALCVRAPAAAAAAAAAAAKALGRPVPVYTSLQQVRRHRTGRNANPTRSPPMTLCVSAPFLPPMHDAAAPYFPPTASVPVGRPGVVRPCQSDTITPASQRAAHHVSLDRQRGVARSLPHAPKP